MQFNSKSYPFLKISQCTVFHWKLDNSPL